MLSTTTKSYLIRGSRIKQLRHKFNIGFMEFCRRSELSTRTLASVEQSDIKVIQDETMIKMMRGFNFTRQGLRKKLIPVDSVAEGSYLIKNPPILDTGSSHAKLTIYLNKTTHKGLEAFAQQVGCSKNQAVVHVLKSQFQIVDETRFFQRYDSAFTVANRNSL